MQIGRSFAFSPKLSRVDCMLLRHTQFILLKNTIWTDFLTEFKKGDTVTQILTFKKHASAPGQYSRVKEK